MQRLRKSVEKELQVVVCSRESSGSRMEAVIARACHGLGENTEVGTGAAGMFSSSGTLQQAEAQPAVSVLQHLHLEAGKFNELPFKESPP